MCSSYCFLGKLTILCTNKAIKFIETLRIDSLFGRNAMFSFVVNTL